MDEHDLAIMKRLDVIEKNIEQIASFLRSKSSTLGEPFPEQQKHNERSQENIIGSGINQ